MARLQHELRRAVPMGNAEMSNQQSYSQTTTPPSEATRAPSCHSVGGGPGRPRPGLAAVAPNPRCAAAGDAASKSGGTGVPARSRGPPGGSAMGHARSSPGSGGTTSRAPTGEAATASQTVGTEALEAVSDDVTSALVARSVSDERDQCSRGRAAVTLWCAGCGLLLACGTEPALSTPAPESARDETADQPREFALAPDVATELRTLLPEAEVQIEPDPYRGYVVRVRWRTFVVRLRSNLERLPMSSLRAVVYLNGMREAGVQLRGLNAGLLVFEERVYTCDTTGRDPRRDPEGRCRMLRYVESIADHAPRDVFDPPAWSVPPSQRRRVLRRPRRQGRARPGPAGVSAEQLGTVFEQHADLQATGANLDRQHRLVLVVDLAHRSPELLCVVAERSPVHCMRTEVESVDAVISSPRTGSWLVIGSSSAGGRQRARSLVAMSIDERGGLRADHLALGGVSGIGEACENHEGYCVVVEGRGDAFQILDDGCIERRRGPDWTALHVRLGDRWLDEEVASGPACVDRFSLVDGLFQASSCGPPTALLGCTDESPEPSD